MPTITDHIMKASPGSGHNLGWDHSIYLRQYLKEPISWGLFAVSTQPAAVLCPSFLKGDWVWVTASISGTVEASSKSIFPGLAAECQGSGLAVSAGPWCSLELTWQSQLGPGFLLLNTISQNTNHSQTTLTGRSSPLPGSPQKGRSVINQDKNKNIVQAETRTKIPYLS